MAFNDLFLHASESTLQGFKLSVEFRNAQAFVPLPVPDDEIRERRFARGWERSVMVKGANFVLN